MQWQDDRGSIHGTGTWFFFSLQHSGHPWEPPTFHLVGTGGSLFGPERPGHEDDHLPTSSAQIKNTWTFKATPPHAFMA
jgi:hypothetical protein